MSVVSAISELLMPAGILVIAYAQLLLVFLLQRRTRRDMQAKAFEIILNFDTSELPTDMNILDELASSMQTNPDIMFKDDRVQPIFKLLNKYEVFSIGIKNGLYDEDTFFEYMGTTFVKTYRRTESIIEALRRLRQNSRIYLNFEAIARRWEGRVGF